MKRIYECATCLKQLGQAHSLKDHYRDVHRENVTNEFTQSLYKDIPNEPKSRKWPKRVFETVACTCGMKFTGTQSWKRHVKKQHKSENFDEFSCSAPILPVHVSVTETPVHSAEKQLIVKPKTRLSRARQRPIKSIPQNVYATKVLGPNSDQDSDQQTITMQSEPKPEPYDPRYDRE